MPELSKLRWTPNEDALVVLPPVNQGAIEGVDMLQQIRNITPQQRSLQLRLVRRKGARACAQRRVFLGVEPGYSCDE
jgi:hypothetical protein